MGDRYSPGLAGEGYNISLIWDGYDICLTKDDRCIIGDKYNVSKKL